MEKTAINPSRLKWCLDTFDTSLAELADKLKISIKTLESVLKNEPVLTINQLNKIAKYFNRSMLFFINPNIVEEDKILSPQFRTINNRRPIHSRKLRNFIEQVENHRKIYIGLLDDLEETYQSNWYPNNLEFNKSNKRATANTIRKWLKIHENISFKELRQLVENKEIMVIISNGFNGPWQIKKNDPVRGFSLYFNTFPVIVVKKQSEGAQAFTLFHELVHLLLHKNSILDYEEDYHSNFGMEKEANLIASHVLITDSYIDQINIELLIKLNPDKVDNYLNEFSKKWCVSNEAILVRLIQMGKIDRTFYSSYKSFKEFILHQQLELELDKTRKDTPIIPRNYRHREPLNIFGRSYVSTVLEAFQNQHITLSKASTFLDNIKIRDVHKLVDYVIQL